MVKSCTCSGVAQRYPVHTAVPEIFQVNFFSEIYEIDL